MIENVHVEFIRIIIFFFFLILIPSVTSSVRVVYHGYSGTSSYTIEIFTDKENEKRRKIFYKNFMIMRMKRVQEKISIQMNEY